jgi:phosphatidate phosphatase APP1
MDGWAGADVGTLGMSRKLTHYLARMRWQERLTRLAAGLEADVDALRRSLGKRRHGDPLRIALYDGYGTASRVHVFGRVLEDEGHAVPAAGDSRWRNLLAMLKRLESDEIAGARVALRVADAELEVVADEEGYFRAWLEPTQPPAAGWHMVEATLLDPPGPSGTPPRAAGRALVPPGDAAFGVVSDLDDTVIQTGATDLFRMARTVLFGSARTRLPFPGVSAFYQALRDGTGDCGNPVFYVSSSPWNLYELLVEFLELQQIPAGPLILRDWGLSEGKFLPTGHAPHKLAAIEGVLDTYPTLPFLLIGDSGQEDPEIYCEVIRRHPGRILAAYIRNVSRNPARARAISRLADEALKDGSALVLADDTLAAARHAAERGWIAAATLAGIGAEKRRDESGAAGSSVAAPPDSSRPKAPTVVLDEEAGGVDRARPGEHR